MAVYHWLLFTRANHSLKPQNHQDSNFTSTLRTMAPGTTAAVTVFTPCHIHPREAEMVSESVLHELQDLEAND